MKNAIFQFARALALSVIAAAAPWAAAAAGDSVRIGVLTDMSGPLSNYYGPGSVEAVKMAVEDFGGKVLGKPIVIVSGDHQNKADIGTAILRRWFDTEGVDAVSDVGNSAVSLAAQPIARDKNKVVILVGSGSNTPHFANCTPNGVYWGNDIFMLANAVTRAIVQDGGASWYFLVSDFAFGRMMLEETTLAVTQAGGTVVGSVKHPFNAGDFSSFLLQAKNSNAKVIGLLNSVGDLTNSLKQAKEFGITPGQKMAALAFTEPDARALGLNVTQGTEASTIFYWNRTPATREFAQRFFKRHNAMPSGGQAANYSGVMHYLKAVAAAGTTDGAAVVKKMKEIKVNDFYADQDAFVREDGRLIKDVYHVRVKKPSESTSEWDVFTVVKNVPGSATFEPLAASQCPMVRK